MFRCSVGSRLTFQNDALFLLLLFVSGVLLVGIVLFVGVGVCGV